MSKPHIKICCITSVEEAAMAISAGASAIGLVADMPSGPGVIEDELIKEIAASCPADIDTFLLSSRIDADDIIEHIIFCGTNTVQLVDAVTGEDHATIKRALPGIKLVQVIHVQDEKAIEQAMVYQDSADFLLLDSGRPGSRVKELGGTGRVHNWDISKKIMQKSRRPVFLAGGLNPDNAAEAVRHVQPYGLDICSGVRTDGRLDQDKLARFVSVARAR